MRRLICENSQSVENYNVLTLELLRLNKVCQCLEELEASHSSMCCNLQNIKLNMLDEQITDALSHAEKKCRKLRTEEVDFLPEVSETLEKQYVQK